MIWRLLLLSLLFFQLVGCAVNPATGKTDFVMMSEQQEIELGRNYAQEIANITRATPTRSCRPMCSGSASASRYGHHDPEL